MKGTGTARIFTSRWV